MNEIAFDVADKGSVTIDIRHAIIAGWTARNADAVAHHIAELEALGVQPPSSVPLYYRVAASLVTTDTLIECVGKTASGEAEPVLMDDGDKLYLGLGSDHTDRQLEAHSVALSKQVCAKPVASTLWSFDEIANHLEQIEIRSFVREDEGQEWVAYQEGTLAAIRPLAELMAGSSHAQSGERLEAGTAMMCGTFSVLSGGVRPARYFRMEMNDPKLDRRIEHRYEMRSLPVIV